jgi:hypothetical protein
MKRRKRAPEMVPIGEGPSWGRCALCRRRLRDFRVKATRSDGLVMFLCLSCVQEVSTSAREPLLPALGFSGR